MAFELSMRSWVLLILGIIVLIGLLGLLVNWLSGGWIIEQAEKWLGIAQASSP